MSEWTERALLDLLWARVCAVVNGSSPRYIMAEHVRYDPTHGGRIIDALAVDTWGSGHYAIEGYEVKCSRGDWLRELRDPSKGLTWARHCARFYVVAPTGIVRRDELPDGWGLICPSGGHLRRQVHSPLNVNPEPLAARQVASLMRAVQQTAQHHQRARVYRLCDQWDALSKGETVTTTQVRRAVR